MFKGDRSPRISAAPTGRRCVPPPSTQDRAGKAARPHWANIEPVTQVVPEGYRHAIVHVRDVDAGFGHHLGLERLACLALYR
jgi:hypothetical protein